MKIPWQRLILSLIGIAIMFLEWRWATFYLYNLPDHSISAFASITTNCMFTIALLVAFFVTGQIIGTWNNQTTQNIIQQAQQYFEDKKDVQISETIVAPKYVDDPAIP